ncbi:MAG: sugar transferase, partial [Bacilli bacterium]
QNRYLKYVLFEEEMDNDKLIGYINQVDDVVILQGLSEYNKNNIMSYCLSKKYTDVYLVPKLYEINIVNSKNDQIRDTPVFVSQSLHLSLTQRFLKRLLDIIVSLIAFIVALPVFIIVPILIKAHDRGPVFYKQERVTRNDKNFMLYKFRTMIVDAEKATGAVWQMENDPRITKVGKFLRATRLDELPQLLNVIKGEMSLIGPRPEREIFVKEFIKSIPDFRYRVNVKPGITGLAQVLGKYNSEPDDKLRFDLIYIRNYSIWLDIKILFLTIRAIFDRDSSATLGIPKLEDITRDLNLTLQEIDMGYLVNKEIKL